MTSTQPAKSASDINRTVAYVFGGVYLLVGLLGFFVSKGFASTSSGKLLGIFEVNGLHNIAHLLIGGALVFAAYTSAKAARRVNTGVGAAYLLLGIIGLFILDSSANILALNGADNGLHFATALVLLVVGLMPARTRSAV